MATTLPFFTPRLIVKNISHKDVRILERLTLAPGEQKDLFGALTPDELQDYTITKALEKPWGDLYREVVEKKSLEIVDIFLINWGYSLVHPSNIVANNQPAIGQVLTLASGDIFTWSTIASIPNVLPPLEIVGDAVSIPKAGATQDGYLSKEDWAIFAAGSAGKPDQKIWEYQDFAAPVSSTITLSSFENGSGLGFNASYIQDSTAVIVLTSDTSQPPTTTLSIPGKWLPGNRVSVSSHIGTTVVLNQAPEATQICRVFYLISLPFSVPLPSDYQEDANFGNEGGFNFLDDNYVNQNQDESIFGEKTFNSQAIFSNSIQIPTGAEDGYILTSDNSGSGFWLPAISNGLTADQHETLRQIIHLANNGPFEGFASGAFRETLPINSPFPTQFVWWESSGKIKKIIDKTITYGANPATIASIQYRVYDTDGVSILTTITDAFVFTGVFEKSRTRTIV